MRKIEKIAKIIMWCNCISKRKDKMAERVRTLEIILTKHQYKKHLDNKPFQVSYNQLTGDPKLKTGVKKKDGSYVELEVNGNTYRKLQNAVRKQRGFRFQPHQIMGGSIFGSVKGLLKNKAVRNIAKQGISMAASKIGSMTGQQGLADMAAGYANSQIDQQSGEGFGSFIKGLKKVAKSPIVGQIVKTALPVATSFLPAPLQGIATPLIEQGLQEGGVNTTGSGLRRGRFQKGSREAKEHMAKLRAMRQGKGFFGDMAKKGLDFAKSSAGKQLIKGAISKVGDLTGQQGLASQANSMIGNGLYNKRTYNDCSAIVGGVPPAIKAKKSANIQMGGSFLPL